MAIITRTVNNPRSIPCPIRIPGYDATAPLITVAPSTTLDLLTVITEDQLIGVQDTLDILIDGGALTVVATFDTSTLEQGYEGGGSAIWGMITGTLSNQTDLQTALNSKLNLSGGSMTGDIDMGNHNISNVGFNSAVLIGDLDAQNHTINNVGLNTVSLHSDLDAQNFKVVNLTDPSGAQDAATKNYVDTHISSPTPSVTVINPQASAANTTSGTYIQVALGADFAVSSSSRKVKASFSGSVFINQTAGGNAVVVTLFVDGVDVSTGGNGLCIESDATTGLSIHGLSFVFLSAPGDTATHNYGVRLKSRDGDTVTYFVSDGVLVLEDVA